MLKTAADLEQYNKGEEKRLEEFIRGISESGAKVVVSGGAIGELAQHFCERLKMMVVKIPSKFELQRLCKATGATAIVRVGPPLPEELGFCDIVTVEEIGGTRVTVFRQDAEASAISTIIVRGSTNQVCDFSCTYTYIVYLIRILFLLLYGLTNCHCDLYGKSSYSLIID